MSSGCISATSQNCMIPMFDWNPRHGWFPVRLERSVFPCVFSFSRGAREQGMYTPLRYLEEDISLTNDALLVFTGLSRSSALRSSRLAFISRSNRYLITSASRTQGMWRVCSQVIHFLGVLSGVRCPWLLLGCSTPLESGGLPAS